MRIVELFIKLWVGFDLYPAGTDLAKTKSLGPSSNVLEDYLPQQDILLCVAENTAITKLGPQHLSSR